jgi:outer membrane protein TolC
MRIRCVIPLAAVLVLASNAGAQERPALSLPDAIREALRANPELVALRAQSEVVDAAIPSARSLDAPTFETQIWGWPVTTLNPSRTDMYMFTAEQELPGRGKRAARELVATRDADVTRRQIEVRANIVVNEVKQAYTDLLLARATSDLYAQQSPVVEATAEAATLRYAAGHAGQHDPVTSVVELARLHADAIEWRERARVAETRLNILLGRPASAEVPTLALADFTLPAADDAERIALDRHPELAMADAAIAREEAELARLRGERRPDYVVGGGYMLQPGGAGAWTARGGITWPNAPWSRGRITTGIDVQEKRLAAARAQREVIASSIRRTVHESIARITAARERIALLQSTVIPHVEHAFDVSRVAYAADRGEFGDLLETERALLSTRMNLAAAEADAQRAAADLETAIGALPEK